MKLNKLIIISAILAAVLLLSACSKKKEDAPSPGDETTHPENGMVYEYSDGGNSDRVVSGTYYKDGKESYKNFYEYWDSGELKTITTKKGDNVTETWNYNYSKDGMLSQMVRIFEEEGVEYRDDYRYDDTGAITELSYYADGEFSGGNRYFYNENGDRTREEQLDPNGDVIIYTEYKFNEKGKTASSHEFMYGFEVNYSLYEYNESDVLTSVKKYNSNGTLTEKSAYEYNSDGKRTRTLTLDTEDNILSYTEHLYDSSGFHYRDIFYEDGTPVYRYDYSEDGACVRTLYN